MNGIQLHDSDHAYIAYDESKSIINFLWKDHLISKEIFQETLSLYADLIEKYEPTRLFIDALFQKFTLTQEVRDWHDNTIIPRYHKAGVKRISFLIPQSIFSELTHKKTFEKGQAAELVSTEFFENQEHAIDWLMVEN